MLSLSILTLLAPFPNAAAADEPETYVWGTYTVDGNIDTGVSTSLALDREGNAHITYIHPRNDAILYARWTDAGWAIEVVDQGHGFLGQVSLALDAEDRPHLSYFQGEIGFVQYGVRTESGWSLRRIDRGSLEGFSSLALDSAGNPFIAYTYLNGDLRLTAWNGTSWTNETVDARVEGARYVSLDLDSSDRPHIAYYGPSHLTHGFENLYYAVRRGGNWSVEPVDAQGNVGLFARLATDSQDRPHIVYRDADAKVLRYTVKVGDFWFQEVVDYDGDTGWDPDIALDDEGGVHVTYYERTEGDLLYAMRTGAFLGWVSQVVDSLGVVGWFTSLELDARRLPHISYYNWTGGTVKYAWASSGALIQTLNATGEAATAATLRGEVLSLGDFAEVNVLFDWRIEGSSEWSSTVSQSVHVEGPVEATLTNLTPAQGYEYRARLTIDDKAVYGEIVLFRTVAAPGEEEAALPLPLELLIPTVGAGVGAASATVVIWVQRRRRRTGS